MLLALATFAVSCSIALAAVPSWTSATCGQSKYADAGDMNLPAAHIVGGISARPNEFPWQVSVRTKSTNSHFCGGIIINENWVLTAAHCLDGETASAVSIVAGEHDSSGVSAIRQTLDVSAITVHASYDSRTMQNDIALARVATPITFNTDVAPACAPDDAEQYTYWKSACSGWGTLSSGGACCPNILRYVTLNVTTNALCDQVYTQDTIYADMICATDNTGSTDRDSCQGDSGGPLVVKETSGTFRVVGIVSWGIGCASGYPGVYARVGYFNSWIGGIIGA